MAKQSERAVLEEQLSEQQELLIFELEKVKQTLKTEVESALKIKQLLEEKINCNMIQMQDMSFIESMKVRLEALLEHEKNLEENVLEYKQMLDEERVSAKMIHKRDVKTIESFKIKIDELLKRLHDSEKLLKIERRIREDQEKQLSLRNSALKSPLKIEVDLLYNDPDEGLWFGKCLKSESFRKALIFQKRYLSGLLASYQQSTNNLPRVKYILPITQPNFNDPINRFRAVVYAVISIYRMQYIVRRWHKGKHIGSSIITKRSTQSRVNSPQMRLVVKPKLNNLQDPRPWKGNSPPCKDQMTRRQELPFGDTINENIDLTPVQVPALLSQYIDRFHTIQQRLGLAIHRAGMKLY